MASFVQVDLAEVIDTGRFSFEEAAQVVTACVLLPCLSQQTGAGRPHSLQAAVQALPPFLIHFSTEAAQPSLASIPKERYQALPPLPPFFQGPPSADPQQGAGWLQSLTEGHTPETEEYGIGSFVWR